MPKTLLRAACEAFQTPAVSIASLRSLYARRQTLYEHQAWARTCLGLQSLDAHPISLRARESMLLADTDWRNAKALHHPILGLPTLAMAFLKPILASVCVGLTARRSSAGGTTWCAWRSRFVRARCLPRRPSTGWVRQRSATRCTALGNTLGACCARGFCATAWPSRTIGVRSTRCSTGGSRCICCSAPFMAAKWPPGAAAVGRYADGLVGQAGLRVDEAGSGDRPLDCLCPGSAYRIAFDLRAGQKVMTLQAAMPRDADFKQHLCADIDGFSLHAAVRCAADDRQALEQLCRYITRPSLANERVQTNAAGQVVLKHSRPLGATAPPTWC